MAVFINTPRCVLLEHDKHKTHRLRRVLATCTFLLGACASPAAGGRPEDAERIGAIVDAWNRSWAQKDPVVAASSYEEEAAFTNAFGFHREGRAAIEADLAEVFAMPFVMAGESRETFRDLAFLRSDVALLRTRVERAGQEIAAGGSLGVREISHLRVFALRRGEWRIVSHLISNARATERPRHETVPLKARAPPLPRAAARRPRGARRGG